MVPGSLDRYVVLDRIAQVCAGHDGTVAEIATEVVERVRELTVRIKELEKRIVGLVEQLAPTLLALHGC
ncbi:MAG: hypothetical protein ACLQPH_07385 [Acidimicrobiales bacterium]